MRWQWTISRTAVSAHAMAAMVFSGAAYPWLRWWRLCFGCGAFGCRGWVIYCGGSRATASFSVRLVRCVSIVALEETLEAMAA